MPPSQYTRRRREEVGAAMGFMGKSPHSFRMSGSGMLWCWGFLHFFQNQSGVAGVADTPLGDYVYLGSTLLVSFAIAVTATTIESRMGVRLAVYGCVLLVLGTVLDLVGRMASLGASELQLMSNIALGGGMGIFWIAWGCLYVGAETESVEYAFTGWFPLLVVLLPAAMATHLLGEAGTLAYAALLIALPCASLACFLASQRNLAKKSDDAYLDERSSTAESDVPETSLRKDVVFSLVNLVCVFAATSLAWNAFLSYASLDFGAQIALFGLGVVVLFFIIGVALRTTRHFSLSTLYRWALPLMAVGVVLFQFSETEFVASAFLCLAIVTTGFEVMGRLFCIYVAKRNPRFIVGIIGLGFATATLGGLIGTSLWDMVRAVFGIGAVPDTLLVALVTFIVAASLALGRESDDPSMRSRTAGRPETERGTSCVPRASDTLPVVGQPSREDQCRAIAEQYGLSVRESDVLVLLAQGRSRAHIRETLYISKGTVDSHIHNIYAKTGISSRDELMRLFLD